VIKISLVKQTAQSAAFDFQLALKTDLGRNFLKVIY
jgi:hypothetical protein